MDKANVKSLESVNVLDSFDDNELMVLMKYFGLQTELYLSISNFCHNDPTVHGSVVHKDSIKYAHHYSSLYNTCENILNNTGVN
jgi:hypothetical protein